MLGEGAIQRTTKGKNVRYFLFVRQVPRHVDDHNALTPIEEQQGFEPLCAVVMQEVMIPAGLDEFGDEHRDLAVRMLVPHLQYVVEDGLERAAVWGIKHNELRNRESDACGWRFDEPIPLGLQIVHVLTGAYLHRVDIW